jgi:hypothetical protein
MFGNYLFQETGQCGHFLRHAVPFHPPPKEAKHKTKTKPTTVYKIKKCKVYIKKNNLLQ